MLVVASHQVGRGDLLELQPRIISTDERIRTPGKNGFERCTLWQYTPTRPFSLPSLCSTLKSLGVLQSGVGTPKPKILLNSIFFQICFCLARVTLLIILQKPTQSREGYKALGSALQSSRFLSGNLAVWRSVLIAGELEVFQDGGKRLPNG